MDNYQLLDEVEQNIGICQWRADELFAEAELRDTDKSRYFAITEFNNCIIIRPLSLFFIEYLRKAVSARCLPGVMTEIKWFPSHFNNLFFPLYLVNKLTVP